MARRIGGRPYKQRGLWTGYPLQKSPPDAPAGAGAPWYLWAAVSSAIALASCAAPEYRTQGPQSLQPFRQTPVMSSGMGVMLGTQVVLLRDEEIRQPDTSAHRLFFGRGAGAAPPQRLELHNRNRVTVEPEGDFRRGDHGLLHRYRVGYQTVGQPWQALQPHVSVQVEAEGFTQHPTDYTPLYGRTTPVAPPVGAPWYLWHQPQSPRLEAEGFDTPAVSQAILYGRGATVLPQHWWVYRWQGPIPDTSQFYEYRSRDFWSDLQPFRITPTNVEPPQGGAFGYVEYRKKKRPKPVEPVEVTQEVKPEPRQEVPEPVKPVEAPKPRPKPKPAPVAAVAPPDLGPMAAALAELRGLPELLSAVAQRKAQEAALAAQAEAERLALVAAADALEAMLLAEKRKRNAALLLILHEAI